MDSQISTLKFNPIQLAMSVCHCFTAGCICPVLHITMVWPQFRLPGIATWLCVLKNIWFATRGKMIIVDDRTRLGIPGPQQKSNSAPNVVSLFVSDQMIRKRTRAQLARLWRNCQRPCLTLHVSVSSVENRVQYRRQSQNQRQIQQLQMCPLHDDDRK